MFCKKNFWLHWETHIAKVCFSFPDDPYNFAIMFRSCDFTFEKVAWLLTVLATSD